MRAFQINIDGKTFIDATKGVNWQSIRFDIDGNAAEQAIGSKITIKNYSSYKSAQLNSQLQTLGGKTIQLFAGFRKQPAWATSSDNYGLLVDGIITSPFLDYKGTAADLVLFTYPIISNVPIVVSIQVGDSIGTAIQTALSSVAGLSVIISPDVSPIVANVAFSQQFPDIKSFLNAMATIYEITFVWGAGTLTVNSINPQKTDSIIINPQNIIGQPSVLNPKQIALTVLMNPNLKQGGKFTLNSPSANYGAWNSGANAVSQGLNISVNGTYIIYQVRHMGDSKSTSDDAWCTQVWGTYAS